MHNKLKIALGLTTWETARAITLLNSLSHGKTIEKAAEERKIPLQEAKGLVEAYRHLGETISYEEWVKWKRKKEEEAGNT